MNLLIIGAGGHGRVVKETAEAMGKYKEIDFLDDNSKLSIGKFNEYEKFRENYRYAFIALGNNQLRSKWLKRLEFAGYEIPTLVHPTAYISPSAKIEQGVIILPKAVIHTNAVIKKGSIIGIGSLIDHDSIINEFCHINTGTIVNPGETVYGYTDKHGITGSQHNHEYSFEVGV